MKFYWIRDKLKGSLSVVEVDTTAPYEVWSIIGDEQMWDKDSVEDQYDILDEIVPPKP